MVRTPSHLLLLVLGVIIHLHYISSLPADLIGVSSNTVIDDAEGKNDTGDRVASDSTVTAVNANETNVGSEPDVCGQNVSEGNVFSDFPHDSGYVAVRANANIFWMLFCTKHSDGARNRPLIMWLQGGPGASSTGYGNMELIGPVGLDFQAREHSWVKEASLLFVDSPVGAGFSYVSEDSAHTNDTTQVAVDLLHVYKHVLESHPQFKTVPFYIFGQSYGGKFGAVFAKHLKEAIDGGEVETDLRGLALGNAWISPEDSTVSWAPLLKYMSILDEAGYRRVNEAAMEAQQAAWEANWGEAYSAWQRTTEVIANKTADVSFYNILDYNLRGPAPHQAANNSNSNTDDDDNNNNNNNNNSTVRRRREAPANSHLDDADGDPFAALRAIMNSDEVRHHLKIPDEVEFDSQNSQVFRKHRLDFMTPVVDTVAELLEEGINVTVYQGQLDLICANIGAVNWVNKMSSWSGLEAFQNRTRQTLRNPDTNQPEAFLKSYENFNFFWILSAGHAVPKDQSAAAHRMLRIILDGADRT